MMANLFSIFDPMTSFYFSFNWLSVAVLVLFVNLSKWVFYNKGIKLIIILVNLILKEVELILKGLFSKAISLLLVGLFITYMLLNLSSLLPYVFTATSGVVMTISISLSLWFMIMILGWGNYKVLMLYHLVPLSTPGALIPLMVVIELISGIIRPLTLAIRLTTNMIAGHLMMSLIGGKMSFSFLSVGLVLPAQLLLILMEIAVAMIQAYVFSVLMTLYISDVKS